MESIQQAIKCNFDGMKPDQASITFLKMYNQAMKTPQNNVVDVES
jgi:hypothetical protein